MTVPAVAIVSGGLDSTTLVYDMIDKGFEPHMLSFNYGQRHKKELTFAQLTARRLGLQHDIIDLSSITHLISNSALTSQSDGRFHAAKAMGMLVPDEVLATEIEVPDGHYAEETMKATVVPNRNMMMLSIAAAVGINEKARAIGIGVHAGDHFIYPDCRPQFITQFEIAVMVGNEGFHNFPFGIKGGKSLATAEPETVKVKGYEVTHSPDFHATATHAWFGDVTADDFEGPVYAPFIQKSKAAIAYRAIELGVPLHLTWSCYKGGENHCGTCGTCVERLEAIDDAIKQWNRHHDLIETMQSSADPIDMTVYDNDEYWKAAIRNAH